MSEVFRQLGSSSDYYPGGMADDGFCGFDPRAWIRFSRGSNKPEFEDPQNCLDHRNRVNLLCYEELQTLSQTNLKLTFHSTANDVSSNHDTSVEVSKKPKRAYWSRPLPQLASFRCVAGSIPKIRVQTSGGESGNGSKRNPVFRSNSFRYEKYVSDDANRFTISEQSAKNLKKVVSVSEEYHTPKDLINHLPLLQDDQQFDQFGTGERPRSSADIRHHQAECRDKMFEKVDKFLVEMPYTDPKDSKLYTQPGVDPSDDQIYKLYVGSETLYCRPYQQIKRGSKFIGNPNLFTSQHPSQRQQQQQQHSSAESHSAYEDVRLGQNCVTIIPVSVSNWSQLSGHVQGFNSPPSSRSPTNESGATPTTLGSETSSDHGSFLVSSPYYLQSDSGEISGPHYENLEFHRVSIRVPTTGAKGVGFNDSLSSNVALQRQKKLNVDRKSTFLAAPSPRTSNVDGDVVDKQYQANVVDSKKFVKFGYSQHEVWNWLHQEDGNAIYVGKNSSTTREKIQSCTTCSQITSQIVNKKSYEVKFTAFEFLAASSRLSPLNLEGMEHFVANMLDQAINCRQKVPKCVKPVNLFPKKIKEEKNSNFCTIRNPQQSHQQLEHQNYNNNNNKGEVFIFGQTVAPVSCSKFHLKNDSNGQMSSSHPQEVIAGHNYQSLYSSVTPAYSSSSRVSNRDRGGAKAYTTLEALNQDIRGFSDKIYQPVSCHSASQIDTSLPLDRQEWYHGSISRVGAENLLRLNEEGSFLVRNSESSSLDFSLSVKSSRGFMHMRIQESSSPEGTTYILGQFSKPFRTVPLMVQYYTENRLPIKGAEHTCLRYPVCEELL